MNKLIQLLFFFVLSASVLSCGDDKPQAETVAVQQTAPVAATTPTPAKKIQQPVAQAQPAAPTNVAKPTANAKVTKPSNKPTSTNKKSAVKWYSWEEAMAANKKNKKKIFVDIYTDWCGWCKRMDATTFSDPEIAKHMNDNFYCVKLDAEQKADINYGGNTYKFIANYGRKGVHELAFTLLDGKMSYPQYVFMDENEGKLNVVRGYKKIPEFTNELKYISSNAYKTKSLSTFVSATR